MGFCPDFANDTRMRFLTPRMSDSCSQQEPVCGSLFLIEVVHNLFEASIDLFRCPTTGRQNKFDKALITNPSLHLSLHI